MRNFLMTTAMILTAGVAMAGGDDVVGGTIDLRSTSGIVADLPTNTDRYEALVANVGELTVNFDSDFLEVDTLNATVFEVDGAVNKQVDGVVGAGGFTSFGGFTVIRD